MQDSDGANGARGEARGSARAAGRARRARIALALIVHNPGDDQRVRSRNRVLLSVAAHHAGWVLLELYELDGSPIRDALTLTQLEDHARREQVRDIVISGATGVPAVDVLAHRARLRLVSINVGPDMLP